MAQASLQPTPPPGSEANDRGMLEDGDDRHDEHDATTEGHIIGADSALGGMITPRPGGQNAVDDTIEGDR